MLVFKLAWYIIILYLFIRDRLQTVEYYSDSNLFFERKIKTTTMNKQALVELVHEKIGGTKVQAEEIVNGIFDAIVATLKKGGEVSIAGIGIFSVKARAARMARNPKTGEQVKVAATTVPKFRAAKALKDAVK
jgi:DNA-binding protein HU-beta